MPEFVVEGGLDDRTILEGFKRITAAGEDAGRKIGSAMDQATKPRKLTLTADPSSIVAMRTRLEQLQGQLERVQVGSKNFRELSAQVRTAEASLARAQTAAQGLKGALSGIGSGLAGQLATLGAGVGLAGLFKQSIDRAVQLETITRKLSNTLGQQGAGGALSFTKGLADNLGLSFTTLASTFGSFTAAATAAGVPIETQRQLFAAVAKSAQSLGLSNEELGGSLLALQQTASKGVVSMEELRGQLGERLPIAFGATAKGLGITQQQLIKLVESGKLTASEFFPALTKGLNELSSGSGGPLTAAQNFAILGNELTKLQTSVGEGLLPGVLAFVQGLTGGLQGPLKSELNSVNGAIGFLKEQIKEQAAFGLDTTEATKKLEQLELKAEGVKAALASTNRQEEIKVEVLGLENQRRELERQGVATDAVREKIKLLSQEFFLLSGSAQSVNIGQIFNGLTQETISIVPQVTEELKKTKAEQDQINQQLEIQNAARLRVIRAGRDTTVIDARIVALEKQKSDLAAGIGLAQQDIAAQKKAQEIADENARKKAQLSLDIDRARVQASIQLNALRRQEPVRQADDQIAVGTQLSGLAAAAGQLEQARFDVVRARVQFEIDNAEKLGITQQGLASRAAQQAELQRQALIARFQALLQQQKVEEALLALSQRRAVLDAQAALATARETALKAQLAVIEAKRGGDGKQIGAAIEAARLAGLQVRIAEERVNLLGRIAPIETAISKATAETARQQLLAQGAALGVEQQLRNINTGAAQASQQATGIVTAFKDASGAIVVLSKPLPKEVQDSYGKISENIVTLGEAIDPAQKNAKEFAKSMKASADNAERLTGELTKAANTRPPAIPAPVRSFVRNGEIVITNTPSRFTGGAVEAGGRYRINDGPGAASLGQESFLSRAGDLSLIRNPLNSTWTAPTAGIVLPAAVTDTLKSRGAFTAGGGVARRAAAAAGGIRAGGTDPAVVQLQLAVTHLANQVRELNKKEWTVRQRVTNSAGTTQVRLLNGLM